MRFLFYSHDGYGLGHTCRNLAIAHALTKLEPRATVLLATGSDDVTRLGAPDRVEILKLPGLRKLGNERYAARYLGVAPEEVRHLRSRLISSAIKSFRPAVMLVDKHPFGAGGELKDGLAAIRNLGGRAVLGLRDNLDDPSTVRAEWRPHNLPNSIPESYDSVLVYGQEEIFDTATAYDFPAALRARTHYTGYVTTPPGSTKVAAVPQRAHAERPLVIATVGGGEDGYQLLETFLHAAANAPWNAVAVTGPMMPLTDHSDLEAIARTNAITLDTFVPGLNHWFNSAAAVVCMGGYNTITQTLAAAVPVICVPRVQPRREQLVRAEAFARLGLLQLVTPDELTPERLRREISAAIATPRSELEKNIHSTIEFGGAEFAARHLLSVAGSCRPRNRQRAPEANVTT